MLCFTVAVSEHSQTYCTKYVLPVWDQIICNLSHFLALVFCFINFTWAIFFSVVWWMLNEIAIKALIKSNYIPTFPPFCSLDWLFCQEEIHLVEFIFNKPMLAVSYELWWHMEFFQLCLFMVSILSSKFSDFPFSVIVYLPFAWFL